MTGSAAELFSSTAWRAMPDRMRGRARDALAHGSAPGPAVTAADIADTAHLAAVRERNRARALKRSRKGKR